MHNAHRLWVLGAGDPEMEAIAALLASHGEQFLLAVQPDGQRVNPGTAYRAVPPIAVADTTVYAVECAWEGEPVAVRVDHHRPGDPGYGVEPAEYLRGSSLGQVLALCGERPTLEQQLAAAADHCLAAAYRGECPGVDPDALMQWRARSRAQFQRRPQAAVLADVERACKALRAAPQLEIAPGVTVADLRGPAVPELPEAAARLDMAFLASLPERDGRTKWVLQSAGPQALAAWPAWAQAQGLVDLYGGDPARGFAGGYAPAPV